MQNANIFTYKRTNNSIDSESKVESFVDFKALLSLVCGFLAARASFLGGLTPLGLAWYSAFAPSDKFGYMLMTIIIGTMTQGGSLGRLKYLAALGCFAVLRRFYKTRLWERPWAAPVAAAGILFVASIVEMLFKGFLYFDIVVVFAESLAVFGTGIVFSKAVSVSERGGKVLSDEEAISLTILVGAAIAGLQGISTGGIKLGNIAGMYIVLLSAFKGGAGVSAASGVAMGFIGGMSAGDIPALAGAYSFVGLSSGLMRGFGKWGIIAGAVLANGAFSMYYSGSSIVIINVSEIAIATILFGVTPNRLLNSVDKLICMKKSFNPAEGYLIRQRRQSAETMGDLSSALACISSFSNNKQTPQDKNVYRLGVMFERTARKVCDDCTLSDYCWSQNFEATYRLFSQTVELIKQGGLDPREIIASLTGKCARMERLIDVSNNMYELYKAENLSDKRTDEYRGLASLQLKKVADVFEDHRKAFANGFDALPQKSGDLERALYRLGYDVRGVCVAKNRSGLYEATIELLGGSARGLEQAVSTVIEAEMKISGTDCAGEGCIITLLETEKFELEVFALCMDKDGNRLVGDSGLCFKTNDGKYYCMLSDGMGSGEKAAEESKYAVELFKTLTQAGFDAKASIKVINSALILGSDNESCTTLDVACIHLQTGEIELYKAGATGTVIKGEHSSEVVRWASMPLGILDIDNIEKRYPNVENPEFIVLMTDGVPDNCGDRIEGEEFIRLAVEAYQDDSSAGLAKSIMDASLSLGKPKDDMTVLVVKINRKLV